MLNTEEIENVIGSIIQKTDNSLTDEHKEIIKELYVKFRTIIVTTIEEQNITSIADLGAPFWFQFLKTIMESVDNYKLLGSHKKEIVIELICVIIENEVDLDESITSEMVKQIRNFAPATIDLIVDVSKHIDINVAIDKKGIADFIANKIFCCICGTK